MPEPISTLGFVGYAALQASARYGTAVSAEAMTIRESAATLMQSVERSISLFGPRATAISDLWEMAAEYAVADWDGEGAHAISQLAVENAEAFIRSLPDDVPMPEFGPEPDGAISIDWIYSGTRFLSLSLGENDRIPYAWIDGTDRGHAVARMDRDRFHQRLLDAIRETMSPSNAAIRVRLK